MFLIFAMTLERRSSCVLISLTNYQMMKDLSNLSMLSAQLLSRSVIKTRLLDYSLFRRLFDRVDRLLDDGLLDFLHLTLKNDDLDLDNDDHYDRLDKLFNNGVLSICRVFTITRLSSYPTIIRPANGNGLFTLVRVKGSLTTLLKDFSRVRLDYDVSSLIAVLSCPLELDLNDYGHYDFNNYGNDHFYYDDFYDNFLNNNDDFHDGLL